MRKKKNKKPVARKDTSSKAKKVAKQKKQTVPRTRNASTMTEAMFFQMLRSAMREKSRWWKPRLKALQAARRTSQSKNKRLKWEFTCCKCHNWFPQTQIEVHHSIPAGKLNSFEDLPGFAERLFAEEGFECVCKNCHKKEHTK